MMRRMLLVLALLLAPMGAVAAEETRLDYNAWCFNVLFNYGVRHGYAEDYQQRMAAHAMAEARSRLVTLGAEQGLSEAQFQALDRQSFEAARSDAEAIAAQTASEALVARYDGCRARGLRGIQAERRHAAFLAERGEQLWCHAVLGHFIARRMIEGEERARRGAQAGQVLGEVLEEALAWSTLPLDEQRLLTTGATMRAMLQVDGYAVSGDRTRFERDYEPCFAMADLPLPMPRFDFPPAAPDSVLRHAEAWDYPLSFEFRQAMWCAEAMRLSGSDPLAARHLPTEEKWRTAVTGDAELVISAGAAAAGMGPDALAQARSDTAAQLVMEVQRFDESGRAEEWSYELSSCAYLRSLERFLETADELFVELSPQETADAAVWCLAAYEYLLGSGRMKEAEAQRALKAFAESAIEAAAAAGLSQDALRERLGLYQQSVAGEIDSRQAPQGSGTMLDYCGSMIPL